MPVRVRTDLEQFLESPLCARDGQQHEEREQCARSHPPRGRNAYTSERLSANIHSIDRHVNRRQTTKDTHFLRAAVPRDRRSGRRRTHSMGGRGGRDPVVWGSKTASSGARLDEVGSPSDYNGR